MAKARKTTSTTTKTQSPKKNTPAKPKSNGATKTASTSTTVTQKMEARVNLNSERLEKVHEKLAKWKTEHGIGEATKLVDAAIKNLKTAAEILADVPDDFIPYQFATPKTPISVGAIVCLTDKRKEEYSEDLKPAEMENLQVLELRGKRIFVYSEATDTKFLIAKSHLMLQETKKEVATA